jgi:hypothetical protein
VKRSKSTASCSTKSCAHGCCTSDTFHGVNAWVKRHGCALTFVLRDAFLNALLHCFYSASLECLGQPVAAKAFCTGQQARCTNDTA